VTYFPGNYEMLAATVPGFSAILIRRRDSSRGIAGAHLVDEFHSHSKSVGSSSMAALTLSMLLASPIVLLHSTAHKNDI